MNSESLPLKSSSGGGQSAFAIADEIPLTVRQAGKQGSSLASALKRCIFGLSESRFPHLRVMGRNIRFLKSELGPFRATFSHEVGYGKT